MATIIDGEILDDGVDPQPEDLEEAFLEQLAEDCTCCPECWDVPCGACQAGAPCDDHCHCDRMGIEPFYEDEDF